MKNTDDEIQDHLSLIGDIERHKKGKMNEWEEGFLESLKIRLDQGVHLSEKQASVLVRIWAKVM